MARNGVVEDIYFHWLLEKIRCHDRRDIDLLRFIHNRSFEYFIQKDKNRASDGLRLRDDFERETGYHLSMKRDCTVLEMLIGLAKRVDEEYLGDMDNPHPEIFFWEMINNLELRSTSVPERWFQIIDAWLGREFDYFGNGSPFPLINPRDDQAEVEIWDQLMGYITENY